MKWNYQKVNKEFFEYIILQLTYVVKMRVYNKK